MAVIGNISKEVMEMILAGAKADAGFDSCFFDCGGETTLCDTKKKSAKRSSKKGETKEADLKN